MTWSIRALRAGASAVALAAVVSSFAANRTATAQDFNAAVVLEGITIQSTRSPRNVLDVPQNITVIDKDELDNEAVTDIDKLTRKVPGVIVSRQTSGADPFSTFGGFTIRGVGGNRVQISVDGSRTAERIIDGPRDFINLDFAKSVDIVRGPASVLWGSDALGGLVAVETLDPEDILKPGAKLSGEAKTTFDTENNAWKKTGLVAASANPALLFLFGYSNITADEVKRSKARADGGIYGCPRNVDFGATPCDEFDPTDTRIDTFLGKIVVKPADGHRIEFTADLSDRLTKVDQRYNLGPQFNFLGALTGVNLDYKRELDLYRRRFGLEHSWDIKTPLLESAKWTLSYSPQGYTRSGRLIKDAPNGDRIIEDDTLDYSEDFYEADIQFVSKFAFSGVSHRFTYGFDGDFTKTNYRRVDVETNVTTGEVDEDRAGGFNFANAETTRADFFIQDEIKMFGGVLELIPALRYATYTIDPKPDADYEIVPGSEPEKISEEALTFKFGATVNLNRNYSIYGQFAQGFKMPTAQQLFTSLNFSDDLKLVPAPDLKPEEVNSYELGLRGKFQKGFFSVNVFYADYTNFIQSFFFVPNTDPQEITYRNLTSVQLYGVEGSFETEVTTNLRAYGSFSYQFGDQKATPDSDEVAYNAASPLNGVFGLKYLFEEYNFEVDVASIWSAAVTRQNDPDNFKPDGFVVFDVNTLWKPTENFEITASVLNVFDKRYFKWPLPYDYDNDVSDSVARVNPLELQTQPGRTFRVGAKAKF
ncbi:MAG: TonB-dependent hemoglobin/transferrin/lactoferrin family receptor [Pseudomonadota bacterium]